jgi:ABC-type polar amino acid transport system ATPase subunit
MISITDLWKSFGTTPVLRGVSLEVTAGQVSVLLGGSGSGKSTLLRMINGLETFDKGSVTVNGTALPGTAGPERDAALLKIRRNVGMVFQKFHLFPHLTVLQNVIEAPVHVLKMSVPEATAVARQLLDRVGMGFKADAMPASLSGGQQQRVAIARTLAMSPEAILFDEPTSALDPKSTAEVLDVMRDLARAGQGMIVVTHSIPFARSVAHKVHMLSAGTIVEEGPPEQVLDAPASAITEQFLKYVQQA